MKVICDNKSPNRTLGLLFIIIDEFPNEVLWRVWLEVGGVMSDALDTDSNAPAVRVWFHAKYPERVKSAWVRQRLVSSFHFKPEWGSIELTKVMVHMLNEVLLKASILRGIFIVSYVHVCRP